VPLAAGSRLGPYEILSALGAGGMGEVYRARDTKLGRDVALKVLPEAFATDSERLARFKREAQVLASLDHPNIGAIYGFEESDDMHALVLQLVEGPTLADRITQGPIPLDDALPIARQIAEALEAAHEKGVIHRDLKPANIKLTPDGQVKVLDFGLAKLLDSDAVASSQARGFSPGLTNSPTITTPAMTMAGVILGTAAYMSPEQAKGRPADKRSDIWAFGCVLYEMLTGKRAFEGEDVSDTLAAVLRGEVDWSLLPASTPAGIGTLLRRSLRKDRTHRLGDAGTARIEIAEALAVPSVPPAARAPFWQKAVPLGVALPVGLAAVLAAAVIAVVSVPRPPSREETPGVARLSLAVPRDTELTEGASVAVSPDGTQVAYVGRRGNSRQLYLRRLSDLESRPLAGTDGAGAPFFSRDGQWVAFTANGLLKRVSTTSGTVVSVLDGLNAFSPTLATWSAKDTIVLRGRGGIVEVPSAGGAPRSLVAMGDTAENLQQPEFLPDSDTLLLTTGQRGNDTAEGQSIEVLKVATGERKVLIQRGYARHYLPTGHLIFQRSGTLMAAPFDLNRLEVTGTPVPVIERLRQPFNGVGAFNCSRTGTCVYIAGGTLNDRTVAIVDRNGRSQPLPLPPKSYNHPRFSPSGDRLSFWIQQLRCELEVYDLERGATTRLASEIDHHNTIWTPDGRQLTYVGGRLNRSGYEFFSWPARSGATEQQMTTTALNLPASVPLSWSPRGDTLAYAARGDIWLLPSSGEPRALVQSKFTETSPAISPDGRWLAYVSDESARLQVYVQPFPGSGERSAISTEGGSEPVWARNGRELFFRNGDQMMVADVGSGSAFSASRPRPLFAKAVARGDGYANYDVSPDGQRFIVVNTPEAEAGATEISVIVNWFDEVKRLVPIR
jgi:Tol biopolymer transport system component